MYLKMKMKTTIVLHDVYCDVTYPKYLHGAIDITKALRCLSVLKYSFFFAFVYSYVTVNVM
jgi:hypothetical protein